MFKKIVEGFFGFISRLVQSCLYYWHLLEGFLVTYRRNPCYAAARRNECLSVLPGETWNLDDTVLRFILPRLEKFAENPHTYPFDVVSFEEWQDILDEMIVCLKVHLQEYPQEVLDDFTFYEKYARNEYKMLERFLELFEEYCTALWD